MAVGVDIFTPCLQTLEGKTAFLGHPEPGSALQAIPIFTMSLK